MLASSHSGGVEILISDWTWWGFTFLVAQFGGIFIFLELFFRLKLIPPLLMVGFFVLGGLLWGLDTDTWIHVHVLLLLLLEFIYGWK